MPNVQVVAFAVFDLGSVAELIAMLICLFGSSKQVQWSQDRWLAH
jgi:hypothetical protein